jgi:ferredoxin
LRLKRGGPRRDDSAVAEFHDSAILSENGFVFGSSLVDNDDARDDASFLPAIMAIRRNPLLAYIRRGQLVRSLLQRHLCGCRNDAIVIQGRHRWVDYRECTGCLTCTHVCPYNAIKITSAIDGEALGIYIDAGKCIAVSGCQECVDHCPAGIYTKHGEKIVVDEGSMKECRVCKTCDAGCPEQAVKVVQA